VTGLDFEVDDEPVAARVTRALQQNVIVG